MGAALGWPVAGLNGGVSLSQLSDVFYPMDFGRLKVE
jgi:hypothetical protein